MHFPNRALLCAFLTLASPAAALAADTPAAPQVTLDTSRLVDIHAWGTNAARLIAEWYPRIGEILGQPGPQPPPAITLAFREGQGVAGTSRNRITVMAGWVRSHPEDLGLVVHELVHIVQAYPSAEPGWVTEGIADYIRWWHFEPSPQTRINPATASYRDSYRTTGAFFAWVDQQHPGTIKRLHAAMRRSAYTDPWFQEATGRGLDELWKSFLAQWHDR